MSGQWRPGRRLELRVIVTVTVSVQVDQRRAARATHERTRRQWWRRVPVFWRGPLALLGGSLGRQSRTRRLGGRRRGVRVGLEAVRVALIAARTKQRE